MKLTEAYHELSYYTLTHPDALRFIHQHAVDAQAAQTADATTKPITVVFALVGLHLLLEQGYTGREVQQAHVALTRYKDKFPHVELPEKRGTMTVDDVLQYPPGPQRDAAITDWCTRVWNAFDQVTRANIASYCKKYLPHR